MGQYTISPLMELLYKVSKFDFGSTQSPKSQLNTFYIVCQIKVFSPFNWFLLMINWRVHSWMTSSTVQLFLLFLHNNYIFNVFVRLFRSQDTSQFGKNIE